MQTENESTFIGELVARKMLLVTRAELERLVMHGDLKPLRQCRGEKRWRFSRGEVKALLKRRNKTRRV